VDTYLLRCLANRIKAHRGIEWVPMTADGSYPIVFSDKSRIFA
jgi:hypothetical protein